MGLKILKKQKDGHMATGPAMAAEVERITEELIQEKNRKIEENLQLRLKHYSALKRPLGEEKAKAILEELLDIAVAGRSDLGKRFEQSITQGSLYEQYYEKLEKIDSLTVLANRRLQEMQYEEQQYQIVKKQYEQVLGKAFVDNEHSSETKDEKQSGSWNMKLKNLYSNIAKEGRERTNEDGTTGSS